MIYFPKTVWCTCKIPSHRRACPLGVVAESCEVTKGALQVPGTIEALVTGLVVFALGAGNITNHGPASLQSCSRTDALSDKACSWAHSKPSKIGFDSYSEVFSLPVRRMVR
jgi:hypothetical protein